MTINVIDSAQQTYEPAPKLKDPASSTSIAGGASVNAADLNAYSGTLLDSLRDATGGTILNAGAVKDDARFDYVSDSGAKIRMSVSAGLREGFLVRDESGALHPANNGIAIDGYRGPHQRHLGPDAHKETAEPDENARSPHEFAQPWGAAESTFLQGFSKTIESAGMDPDQAAIAFLTAPDSESARKQLEQISERSGISTDQLKEYVGGLAHAVRSKLAEEADARGVDLDEVLDHQIKLRGKHAVTSISIAALNGIAQPFRRAVDELIANRPGAQRAPMLEGLAGDSTIHTDAHGEFIWAHRTARPESKFRVSVPTARRMGLLAP